jgi:ATP-dependent Lhr-like helicase
VVNHTLGGIFDALLSEREVITGWWADGYRILIETPRNLTHTEVESMPTTLFNLTDEDVESAFRKYVKAKFPYAYKMKFVAERFGALPRGKTMSYERQAKLRASFENTPIYEETLREAMLEKADLTTTKKIMHEVLTGKISVSTLVRIEKPTPLAYHILAQYADISELMAPERVVLSNIDKMKNALNARTATLLCMKCGVWTNQIRVRELPEEPHCENCNSRLLTMTYLNQNIDELKENLKKRREGKELNPEEIKELTQARRKADLVLSYGKQAVLALQVKGVGPETASRILGKMNPDENEFYLDLLKAKIQYLRTREFWDDKEKR